VLEPAALRSEMMKAANNVLKVHNDLPTLMLNSSSIPLSVHYILVEGLTSLFLSDAL